MSKLPKKAPLPDKKLPTWVTDHFTAALDAHDKIIQIARLSAGGIAMHRARPQAIRVLAQSKGQEENPETTEALRVAERDAALAEREVAEGFPLLYGLMTIAIWSWTENFVKSFVELWLLKKPNAFRGTAIQRLKVRLGDYLQLSKADQARFLVELLEQELSSPLKQGVNRLGSLLETVGFSVDISENAAKLIYELQKVRNNLAHRNGIVDQSLVTACPWLKLKRGKPLHVSRPMLLAYSDATASLLLQLLYKVGDEFTINLRPDATAGD